MTEQEADVCTFIITYQCGRQGAVSSTLLTTDNLEKAVSVFSKKTEGIKDFHLIEARRI